MISALVTLLATTFQANSTTPSVELVGVCSITAEGVTAWTKDRKPLPDLARRIETQLTMQDYSQVNIRVGRKNRWLIFRNNPGNGYYQAQISVVGHQNNGSLNLNDESLRTLQFVYVAGLKSEKTVDATAAQTIPTGEYLRFAPKAGSTIQIGKESYTLGEFVKSENKDQMGGFSGPGFPGGGVGPIRYRWTALANGPAPTATWSYPVSLYDSNSSPINESYGASSLQYVAPLGALQLTMMVDPATVALFAVPTVTSKTTEYKDIPLDR